MDGHQFRTYVGIDSSSDKHEVCVVRPGGGLVEGGLVEHSGSGVTSLIEWLSRVAEDGPASVAVAIEVPHGAVVEALVERGFAVFSVNPKQLDRLRDRYTVAGAKDDRRDAFVLADSLRTDEPCFKRIRLPSRFVVEIRELSRLDEDLHQEHNRGCNQLRALLNRYFPQLLQLSPAADDAWVWEILRIAPVPLRAARLTVPRLECILKKHRIRRIGASEVAAVLRTPALLVSPGTAEVVSERALLLVTRLQLLRKQRRQVGERIEEVIASQASADGTENRDIPLLRSLPGLGQGGVATLLAEAWGPLSERDYYAFRAYAGLAPVTRQSGKKRSVVMRYACNQRLRNACYHWSRNSLQRDAASREHYARLRAAGHSHGRALRGVADRLANVLFAVLRTAKPYECGRRRPAGIADTA